MVKERDIPKKVKIGYIFYKIKAATEDYVETAKIAAELSVDKEQILFDKKLSINQLVNALIHEVVHGIIDNWGIQFPNNEAEEIFTEAFANGWTTVFLDNQEFITWLNDELER